MGGITAIVGALPVAGGGVRGQRLLGKQIPTEALPAGFLPARRSEPREPQIFLRLPQVSPVAWGWEDVQRILKLVAKVGVSGWR